MPFGQEPVSVMQFTPLEVNYSTFPDDRFPEVGIYYVFPNRSVGICREFKIDVPRYLCRRGQRIFPVNDFDFLGEESFLRIMAREKKQAIRINVMEGISFRQISDIVAEMHRNEFFQKNYWLGHVHLDQ